MCTTRHKSDAGVNVGHDHWHADSLVFRSNIFGELWPLPHVYSAHCHHVLATKSSECRGDQLMRSAVACPDL